MSARDVIETLAILLGAGLVSELVASVLRLPRMVVLVAAGALLGPEAMDAVDLPLDSIGVQLLLTLGVSMILFHGGLGLTFAVLRPVVLGLGLLAIPGVVITAIVTGAVATIAFDVPLEAGLLIGAVLAPTDPAILIPLFERLRVRAKVTQTIVAMERAALDRWGRGDPQGYLSIDASDLTYFDPTVAQRLDGIGPMRQLLEPLTGRIHVDRFDMIAPKVQRRGNVAVLTFNLVSYRTQADGSVCVELSARGPQGSDQVLAERLSRAYDRRMGR